MNKILLKFFPPVFSQTEKEIKEFRKIIWQSWWEEFWQSKTNCLMFDL